MGWLFGKGETSGRSPVDALVQELRSADFGVCRRAAEKAGEQRLQGAVPALIELLYRTGSGSKPAIATAATALGNIGDLRALHHLREVSYMLTGDAGDILAVLEADAPDDETLAADNALYAAGEKISTQPGAEQYITQLDSIVMHRLKDMLGDLYIDSDIQNENNHGFTMRRAKPFFKNFRDESFACGGTVGAIRIYDGREHLPARTSYANGWLYSQTLDEIEQRGGDWPTKTVGSIYFEYGGTTSEPYVLVKPQPNWPRPSIVRRREKTGGFRFEELA